MSMCFLIHSADVQSLLVVITIFAHSVCNSVRPHFSKSSKTKQFSYENSDLYWPWIVDLPSGSLMTLVLLLLLFEVTNTVLTLQV